MSKDDKFNRLSAGLGDSLDKIQPASAIIKPKTAPGQLLAFSAQASLYEKRIAELEDQLKDATSTMVSINLISMNPWQPRTYFNHDEIVSLASTIAEVGLVQPIIVRRVQSLDTQQENRFELIAGERRLRAHQHLGLTTIKAVITSVSDEEMALMALAENLGREDLSDFETSIAIRRAESSFPNRKEMALSIGIERSDLYRYLAYDSLPKEVVDELSFNPKLIGRSLAEDISKFLKEHGEKGVAAVIETWPRLKKEEIEQKHFISAAASLVNGKKSPSDRDIRKLFVNKEHAGTITREKGAISVKIKAGVLSLEEETSLADYIQALVSKNHG